MLDTAMLHDFQFLACTWITGIDKSNVCVLILLDDYKSDN